MNGDYKKLKHTLNSITLRQKHQRNSIRENFVNSCKSNSAGAIVYPCERK